MFLASRLRLLILKEPLLRPPQQSPFRLFIQETKTNLRFDIYLFLLLLITCFGLALIFFRSSRDGGNVLLYTIGFLLIFCSYNLQKVIEANRMLGKSLPNSNSSTWFWSAWGNPWRVKFRDSFERSHLSNLLSHISLTGHSEKESTASHLALYKNLGTEEERQKEENPSTKGRDIRKKTTLATLERKSPSIPVEKKSSVKERTYSEGVSGGGHQVSMVFKAQGQSTINRNAGNGEKRKVFLGNLMKIFQFKAENDENLKRHVLNLRNIEIQVERILEEFTNVFKLFMKEAEKIEDEMVEFNASTRYLNISLNELRMEIKKYFSNLPNARASQEILNYLSTLARNYQDSENTGGGDIRPVIRYENKIMFFLGVQMVLCLVLFLAALARLEAITSILKPIVSVGLIVVTLSSVPFLLNGQMLDRSCKSGSIKGCSFTSTHIGGVTRLEVVSKANGLESQLGAILKESEYIAEILRLYVKSMMDTRVNAKMSVFSNLFNKILFVYDDFDHLTKRKVEKGMFFSYIKMMSRLLENITGLLEFSERKDMVDIYVNERAFLFWLSADKDSVVESIREITEAGPQNRSEMPPKWCVCALEGICDGKDGMDILFLLTLIGGPAFLIFLYL
ncbi:hypothetical protein P7C65_03s4g04470 [Encephalitozoon intestinalis]|nr:hypothetical protein GPK93_03g04720 [Encephalitozoon intestinalis]